LFVGVREGVYINIVYIVMNPITSNLFVGVREGVYINIVYIVQGRMQDFKLGGRT